MRRRSLITFIIMNVLISLGVAFGVISLFGQREPSSSGVQVVTVEIRITSTPNPDASPQIIIVTATPLPGTELALLPTGLFDDALSTPDLTRSPAPTIDPAIIGEDVDLQGTATALPENCIPYVLKDGDTPFGIAEEYGADGFALMEINGLDDTAASLLQIGDVLIVPLAGCTLTAADIVGEEAASALSAEETLEEETEEPTAGPSSTPSRTPVRTNTPTPTFTPSLTNTPSDTPTVTLPPTAANAQIEVTGITSPGDVTAEAVTIRNNGNTVNVTGWTLRDNDGNAYTFPEQILFSNATVTVYTRVGDNTPIALYWGRSQGVWGQEGDAVTLADEDGAVQSTLRVP
ncbi:MAG: lamin tail domain-containing protein [Burkholderiales bacterium]|nr:lamin tail domain-containing protein [Anaerolineae bacterium]